MGRTLKSLLSVAVVTLGTGLFVAACQQHQAVDTSDNVAVVNKVSISKNAFEKQLEELAKRRTSRMFTDDQKKEILQEMVDFELILQQAMKEDFAASSDTVKKLIVAEYLRARINKKIAVSEAEINQYYKENKDVIDTICVSHILVDIKQRDDAAAKRRALEVIAKLKDNYDFGQLAQQFSDDTATVPVGGDLGCINRKKPFVPEFMQGAFALKKVGDYSEPVKTMFGYHVILLMIDNRGLANNRSAIQERLEYTKNKADYDAMLLKLKQSASLELFFEKLPDINLSLTGAS